MGQKQGLRRAVPHKSLPSHCKVNAQLEKSQFTGTYILCVRVVSLVQRPVDEFHAASPTSGAAIEMPTPSPSGERSDGEVGSRAHVPLDAPIDLVHLRRYTLGDHELEMEILGLFIEQAPATIESMLRAGSDRDWQRAAHTLKGSARAVGAWHIAELAERAESLGGMSDRSACERLLGHLKAAADEARSHIRALSRTD